PPPLLNNPPLPPEIAIYAGTERLDAAGPVVVAAGTTLTLRHGVSDFETADKDMPFAAFALSTADGRGLIIDPRGMNPTLGVTASDPNGPLGAGGRLDFQFTFTMPATVTLVDPMGTRSDVPANGMHFNVLAFYIDSLPVSRGIATFTFKPDLLQVK